MSTRIAVVGVGLMGSSLAKHLLSAGFPVTVHDADPAKVEALASEVSKGRLERDPATIIDFYSELAGLERR